jgi:hypothetical protein
MLRAAELRGIPLLWWVQRALHRAAHDDWVEVRSMLEDAGFANKNDRLRAEATKHEALHDKDRVNTHLRAAGFAHDSAGKPTGLPEGQAIGPKRERGSGDQSRSRVAKLVDEILDERRPIATGRPDDAT